jgi:hypothetical protein
MLSASALVVAGLAVPADAATHTAYVSDTHNGIKLTARVSVRDVNLNTLGAVVRVDVQFYTAGGTVTIDSDNWVDVAARNGYDYGSADLVKVSGNRYIGEIQLDPFTEPGIYDIGLYASATGRAADGSEGYPFIIDDNVTSITVKRATQIRVTASPNPATVGKPVVVSGTLKKLDIVSWKAAYVPAAGARVGLFFDPAGDKPQVYKGSVTVNSQGKFSKTFTASGPGVWRAKFPGTTSTYLAPSGANVSVSTR